MTRSPRWFARINRSSTNNQAGRTSRTTSRTVSTALLGLTAATAMLLSACEGSDLGTELSERAEALQTQIETEMSTQLQQSGSSSVAPAENPVGTFSGPSGQALVDQSFKALVTLESLPVKGRAPKTGYSRDQFGPAWSDDVTVTYGGNGCDTRNDILARDLKQITYRAGDHGCTVASGVLDDPYTGTTIEFVRGKETSLAVHIDHVVALADAWQKGAQQLTPERRRDLANDPRNLLAVDGPANTAKSDSDAASWLPPNASYRCTMVAKQIEVKSLYDLWVTQAERDAMTAVLEPCAGR